jgi:hypothetical protein
VFPRRSRTSRFISHRTIFTRIHPGFPATVRCFHTHPPTHPRHTAPFLRTSVPEIGGGLKRPHGDKETVSELSRANALTQVGGGPRKPHSPSARIRGTFPPACNAAPNVRCCSLRLPRSSQVAPQLDVRPGRRRPHRFLLPASCLGPCFPDPAVSTAGAPRLPTPHRPMGQLPPPGRHSRDSGRPPVPAPPALPSSPPPPPRAPPLLRVLGRRKASAPAPLICA